MLSTSLNKTFPSFLFQTNDDAADVGDAGPGVVQGAAAQSAAAAGHADVDADPARALPAAAADTAAAAAAAGH